MIRCPECSAEIDVDEDEVEEGEILSCPECESELEVSQIHPVHLNIISDEDDDDDEDEEEEVAENGDLPEKEEEDDDEEDDEQQRDRDDGPAEEVAFCAPSWRNIPRASQSILVNPHDVYGTVPLRLPAPSGTSGE